MTRPLFPHPTGWQAATLEPDPAGQVIIDAASGSTPSTAQPECWGGTIPWLTPKEVTEAGTPRFVALTERMITDAGLAQAARLWPPETVMLTKRAPVGHPVINSVPMATNQGFLNFRCGANLLPEFLYYWFHANSQYLDAVANGSTYPELYVGDLFEFEIALPPLSEQRAIVRILGRLDDKIELNRRMNETLDSTASAIFKSWFLDFDPVRCKMEGHQPRGMNPETAALFPDSFEESRLGPAPSGWRVASILEEADLLSGGTPKTSIAEYWNGDIPWASAKDVSQCSGLFLMSTERSITRLGLNRSSTKIIEPFSTVVVARGATTGRMAMTGGSMAMNQTCYALKSRFGAPFNLFCHAREFMSGLVHSAHGSVFDTITTSTFEASTVLVPPAEMIQAFERCVEPMFLQIHLNHRESQTLATLRELLLLPLISGQMGVGNAEQLLASTA